MIRVAVAGALGRMGRIACAALENATGSIAFAGGYARTRAGAERITDDLEELFGRGVDVLLDLSTRPGSVEISMSAVAHGVRPVIGASGWTEEERNVLAAAIAQRGIGGLIVPNFSVGAVVMMRLAEEAAAYFEASEIVELHHADKKDAPSGTAATTADRIARISGKRPPIHSVRLPGLVAHQEVLFGGTGELLTIRHDSYSRESFVPGMFAAVRAVMHARGLVVGLEEVLTLRQARGDALQ
jgi:4-hydroxy-tetrahydrodipicolinate reductase